MSVAVTALGTSLPVFWYSMSPEMADDHSGFAVTEACHASSASTKAFVKAASWDESLAEMLVTPIAKSGTAAATEAKATVRRVVNCIVVGV